MKVGCTLSECVANRNRGALERKRVKGGKLGSKTLLVSYSEEEGWDCSPIQKEKESSKLFPFKGIYLEH
ncbi:unnamed protein product [Sphenostylis stenocarpa]|uniref:Uncharacterized protein n=1 Tax=Sphenostylis stenocarpa TaxID=92480 RepID=A0AA86VJS4_9FABA|nr:unnamed protein product [Sphenostylis stenocarpa]